MLGRRCRNMFPALLLVVCAFTGLPASAHAGSGLYLQLGAGYGDWTGDELVTREAPGGGDVPEIGAGCCPGGTFSGQLRIGVSILGIIAPEAVAFGSFWNHGNSNPSGGGFVGGGLRFFPLGLLEELRVVDLDDFPFDFSIAAAGAFAIVGSNDFGYDGFAVGTDITAEWILASFFTLGVKLDLWFPTFDPFAITSRAADRGRCLDGAAMQVFDDNIGPEGVIDRSDSGPLCPSGGRGPNTTVISPQVIMTLRFDIL